jgi:hypothetical protein
VELLPGIDCARIAIDQSVTIGRAVFCAFDVVPGAGKAAGASVKGLRRAISAGVNARNLRKGLQYGGDYSGPWIDEVSELTPGGAVAQLDSTSCVAACGEMLTQGGRSQKELMERFRVFSDNYLSDAPTLALELGAPWVGGALSDASIITLLQRLPVGGQVGVGVGIGTSTGHFLVARKLADGSFFILDPWAGGSTYVVTSDWLLKWERAWVYRTE